MTTTNEKNNSEKSNEPGKLAVIRIRGTDNVHVSIRETFQKLNLTNQHMVSVVPNSSVIRGMLQKAKDFVTWGELDEETYTLLKTKAAKTRKETVFRLQPPRGGYERKGIKVSYTNGGALGNRGAAINILLKKMI
ncbi:MAG: uL30 family ribosomal protein [Candidatus Woesearchaeota archaeon]